MDQILWLSGGNEIKPNPHLFIGEVNRRMNAREFIQVRFDPRGAG
ncbi:hypothetical protein LBMAG31_00500 [Nitrosomonadaceae bacterium]|nr:hypothetical protein LBMAG31_00500 [Nitrosomonadaceae bacterium]